MSEKELKKHLKKRVGSKIGGASKDIKVLFGAGRMSVRKKQKANLFSFQLINQIEIQIKNKSITSIDQMDRIIDNAIEIKRNQINDIKNMEGTPRFTVKRRSKPVVISVETHNKNNIKKAGAAVGGGILLGPVGAVAGYALAGNESDPQIKHKKVTNDFDFKHSYVEIYEHKIIIKQKNKNPWPVLFDNIVSIEMLDNSQGFEVIKNDNTHFSFINEDVNATAYTENLFKKLLNNFEEYNQ